MLLNAIEWLGKGYVRHDNIDNKTATSPDDDLKSLQNQTVQVSTVAWMDEFVIHSRAKHSNYNGMERSEQ